MTDIGLDMHRALLPDYFSFARDPVTHVHQPNCYEA